jgi:hypothetical protein
MFTRRCISMLVSTCVYVHTSRMYTIHNPMQVCVYAYPAGMHLRGMCHFALAARAVGLRACISGVSTTLTFELEVARICTLKDAREKKTTNQNYDADACGHVNSHMPSSPMHLDRISSSTNCRCHGSVIWSGINFILRFSVS